MIGGTFEVEEIDPYGHAWVGKGWTNAAGDRYRGHSIALSSQEMEVVDESPKYSLPEIERRWLVDLPAVDLRSTAFREIEDLYIADSRLRLRKVSGPNELTFKLGKKYGKRTVLSEPITNLYLTEAEYRGLVVLPGKITRKRRYALPSGSLDVYLEPHGGLAILEVEFASEEAARQFEPPPFVTREITNDPKFSGASLAEHREIE